MVRIPGSHVSNIKNRSSKQNIWFTKMKPALMSMSNEQLEAISKKGYRPADIELKRRVNKKTKKESK